MIGSKTFLRLSICLVMIGVLVAGSVISISLLNDSDDPEDSIATITTTTANDDDSPSHAVQVKTVSLDDSEAMAQLGLIGVPLRIPSTHSDSELVRFQSSEDLKDFVGDGIPVWSPGHYWPPYPYPMERGYATNDSMIMVEDGTGAEGQATWKSAPDYSETNVQVGGIDEADIVKTDGKYIYVVLKNKIVIVDAYPAQDAEVLSTIELDGNLQSMYISEDRLVIFETVTCEQTWEASTTPDDTLEVELVVPMHPVKTHINVYDVSERAVPELEYNLIVDGQYWDSRMIGDQVYVVVNEPTYCWEDDVIIPKIYLGDTTLETPATDILHSNDESYSYNFTTVVSIDVNNGVQDAHHIGYGMFLLDNTHSMYVSQDNIYLIRTHYDYYGRNYYSGDYSTIHRIHIDGGEMDYTGSGDVPGRILNQFSMDEYDGYFRVVTTTNWNKHNVYVLDANLDIVGSLEDIAPRWEQFHSARFMGNRCYMVTFRQIDPLFVIDLSDPINPAILGDLKITGFSDYLHPYDETHLIGIGRESTTEGMIQGIKISLFDVSDVSNPTEIAKYEIGGQGTESPVLYDHKAFLFDRAKNLLVMPVLVREQWNPVSQGAYVFHISPEEGIQLRGTITHFESDFDISGKGYDYASPLEVKRSLYIGDVLYTISDAKIEMNSLDILNNLEHINEVMLPEMAPQDVSAQQE